VGPLTPTTFFDNTDISTCPKRPLPLVWHFTMMAYAFLRSLGLPISQVGHSGPLIPLSLIHPIILPSTCSQHVLPLFSHHSAHKYTQLLPFCTPLAPQLHSSPLCSLSLHFRIFWDYLRLPPATNTSPHLYTSYWIVFPYPPPTHPFLPFNPFLYAFLCSFQF
jgi:hypothetical protein